MRRSIVLSCLFLLLATSASFERSLSNGWTTWDDNVYVTDNPDVSGFSRENIKKVWSKHYNGSYLPLTMMSYMVDYTIGEYDPFVYHSTNLIIHLANTLLVFWFIFVLSERHIVTAVISGLIFGIHPMHVESVAWISGRKDVLNAFFILISLISYLSYRHNGNPRWLLVSFAAFTFALLSKVIGITLPFLILLIDYYQGRKLERAVIVEKIPFFAAAAAFAVIGFIAQLLEHAVRTASSPLYSILIAHYALTFYFVKLIFPVHLSSLYPYPDTAQGIFSFEIILSFFAVYLFLFILWKYRNSKNLFFGALWFLVVLLPVLQIVRFSNILAADRFTYLAYIGISLPMGFWAKKIYERSTKAAKRAVLIVGVTAALLLAYQTHERCKVWKNNTTLWNDVRSRYPSILDK